MLFHIYTNMKKNKLIFISLIILVIVILLSIFFILNANKKSINYESKNSAGEVTFDLTPIGLVDGQFTFSIEINTHTVDLSQYDLKDYITFNYDEKSLKPIKAPQLQGHHNSGTLIFNLNEIPEEFNIKIIGIPDVDQRILEWK